MFISKACYFKLILMSQGQNTIKQIIDSNRLIDIF